MLLNHKEAIDFVLEHPDYLDNLTVRKIEDIHSLLTKELGITRNLRNRRVGITGTNYPSAPIMSSDQRGFCLDVSVDQWPAGPLR